MTNETKKPIDGEAFTKVLRELTDPIIEKWEQEWIEHYPIARCAEIITQDPEVQRLLEDSGWKRMI